MKFWRILVYIVRCFFESDCANRAAALAYTTLLSLVPLVMLSFWILSLFPVFSGIGETLQQFIVNNFVAHSAQKVSIQLNYFLEHIGMLSWSSLVGLGVVSALMIYDMAAAVNSIWQVKVKHHFALSLSFYSLALVLAPIFLGIFMLFSSYLATLPLIMDIAFLKKPFVHIFPYLVALVMFTAFNWVLPSCAVPFRYAAIAGAITAALFEIGKYFFGLYMSFFPTYRVIYGALAAIPIFLLWIYTSWVIVLLGAVICRVMTKGIPREITESSNPAQ